MRPTNLPKDRGRSAPVRPGTSVTVSPMAQAPETERVPDGDRQQSLQSLERGMAVIQVFSRERPALTLSEVANLTGITRATARRILLTLEKLGHVRSDGRLFSPTPRLLTLGWAYLSSLNLSELALPLMETLVEETHESCSAATLDLPDVVYVARVPTRRIMSITLSVGTRLPAHCTSMGRVLLAALPPDELDRYLTGAKLEAWTERTTTDPDRLRAALDETRQRGWALVDQELEIGLRSVAAPIRRGPDTIAALNVSSAVSRVSLDDLRRRILPPLVADGEHDLQRADPAGPRVPPHRQLSAGGRAAGAPASVRSAYGCAHYEHDGQSAPRAPRRPCARRSRRRASRRCWSTAATRTPSTCSTVAQRLELDDEVAYVLPRAADRSWYPGRFYDPMEDNEPWLGWSLQAIEAAVAQARGGGRSLPRVALVGFSQGACIVAEHLARRPRALRRRRDPHRRAVRHARPTGCRSGSLGGLPMFFGIARGRRLDPGRRRPRHRRGLPARRRALRAARLRRPGARDQRRRDRRRPHPAHRPLGALCMTDAFLVGGVRTPFGRYRGALADSRPDDLAALVLGAALERAGVPHDAVDEVIFGAANQAGEDNRNVARMAALLAGLPDEVPGYTVNRLCASSLQAVASAAQQIRSGEADVVVAGGVESMTRAPMVLPKSPRPWAAAADVADTTLGWRLVNPKMQGPRRRQGDHHPRRDRRGGRGPRRHQPRGLRRLGPALAAAHRGQHASGWRSTSWRSRPARASSTADEVPRADTNAEALAKLKPAFKADGIVTAGSASPLSDGASAIVVASGEAVERHGLAPRARIVASASAGVPPHIMGLGPVPSTRKVLERSGWEIARPRRRGDQRGLRDAGHREHPPPRARPRDRQRLRRRDRRRPSPGRLGRAARARPPAAPGGRRPQARPGHPVHRRRAGHGAHRRACLRALRTLSRDSALR